MSHELKVTPRSLPFLGTPDTEQGGGSLWSTGSRGKDQIQQSFSPRPVPLLAQAQQLWLSDLLAAVYRPPHQAQWTVHKRQQGPA